MKRIALILVLLCPAFLQADIVISVRDKAGHVVTVVTVPTGGSADVAEVSHPLPPQPPSPPVPPTPVDPFVTKVQAAYTAETATDKAKNVKLYAGVWRKAALGTVDSIPAVTDPRITTLGALLTNISTDSAATLPKTTLPGIRRVVGDELNAKIGNDPTTPLTDDLRAKIAAEFVVIAQALEGVK